MSSSRDVVGLVPAAGLARRLGRRRESKEIIQVGGKAVCEFLLEQMAQAGITKIYLVLREGKWDIPKHLGDGSRLGLRIAYLLMGLPYGPPYSLDQAYPFVRDTLVAFGFPDILFDSKNAFGKLIRRQAHTRADIVLGLFRAVHSNQVDMVQRNRDGGVTEIVFRPVHTRLRYSWCTAIWTPRFTCFLHEHLAARHRKELQLEKRRELSVGEVVQAAITARLKVDSLILSEEPYLDVGTPENLAGVKQWRKRRGRDSNPR